MKHRFFASGLMAVLLLNVVGLAGGDNRRKTVKQRQVSRLVNLLPASDGVAVFDAKRFFNDALPKVLSANQPLLGQITQKITEMENRTGIDLRKFEQVAVGLAVKPIEGKNVDVDGVAIASGDISTDTLLAVAKLASKGTYREEKFGDKTLYVFSPKDLVPNTAPKPTDPSIADALDKALAKDVAVAALSGNTLVIGSLARVRDTLAGTTHVGADVTSLLSQSETAVASFGLRTPGGMSGLLPLDNDELGKNIDSIKYVSGFLDVGAAGTTLQVVARTAKLEQAKGLKDTLDVLQVFGKTLLGSSKRQDQKVYARIVENAKIGLRGTLVTLELSIQQADLDILVAGIK